MAKKKLGPLPTSAPHRDTPVGLLDRIFTRLMLGSRSTQTVSDATKRARKRLQAHRAKWDGVPSGEFVSRQRTRRHTILRQKQVLTAARKEAAMSKVMGGSAVIRTLDDIERVLG